MTFDDCPCPLVSEKLKHLTATNKEQEEYVKELEREIDKKDKEIKNLKEELEKWIHGMPPESFTQCLLNCIQKWKRLIHTITKQKMLKDSATK